MTFDELVRKVDQAEPDRALVGRRVLEVVTALGFRVDEASGELVQRDVKPWKMPEPQNDRWVGRGRARRRR